MKYFKNLFRLFLGFEGNLGSGSLEVQSPKVTRLPDMRNHNTGRNLGIY